MKLSTYQARGFYPLSGVSPAGCISVPAAIVNIRKGDYLIDDGGGYATNTATDTSLIFYGIAAENCDNSAGSLGDLSVLIIPFDDKVQFSVPVGNNAVISRGYVGALYDLHTAYQLDIADTACATGSVGFWVEDFDACAEAIDGTTYGYAIGRFRIAAP